MLTGSTFANNQATGGNATITGAEGAATGGIAEGGAFFWAAGGEGILINNTFAFNTATGGNGSNSGGSGSAFGGGAEGGALFLDQAGKGGFVGIANNTVAYNTAAGGTGSSSNGTASGGGIASTAAGDTTSVQLINDLVAKNTAGVSSPDLFGGFDSLGNNLIGDVTGGNNNGTFSTAKHDIFGGGEGGPVNPGLDGQLRNNGGPTQTIALLPGSKAIDHAAFVGIDTDQRGVHRPQGLFFDIGAYEFAYAPFSESYLVHWNATPASNNFTTGNLLTPLLAAGFLPKDLKSSTTLTIFVPKPPPGFTVKADGSFIYKPPVGFSQSNPPLTFQFGVKINGEDVGIRFNVFITVARGSRLSQPM
jgi:hypothetical protein